MQKGAKSQYSSKPNAVTLMQKLPSEFNENPNDDRHSIKTSSVTSVVTGKKGTQQKRNLFFSNEIASKGVTAIE